ncbi:TIGR03915 family putative DNA repair protein [Lacrimispora sp. 210928-DFI.3.58]|uniref:TIGR03915 family putative DNA repair protein n=1 Tax=Lacrimispora sp. 210928-DFI.3.58 TaxID=2883214 RepID=UPI001D0672A9|nr:TIGR03915 family putative DNA repair protein [Lacrimispora sp. 210928-DFI.3.58]MCB7320473.1 TIGR03915 family putative DNA repair protein [Lacrimispora sp. 210928-DFI.3.58]
MTVYVCEPDFESILCGVYDAWMSCKGHDNVRLEIGGCGQEMELFCDYVDVVRTEEKSKKVLSAVSRRLSQEVYRKIYVASLSQEPERADRIYRFLIQAFRYGPKISDMLQLPEVYEIFRICRNVYNENHLLVEFIRFSQAAGNILVSRIGPKNDVLPLLSPHFADRLPEENWIIYDENREKASVHPRGQSWFLIDGKMGGSEYGELWKECLSKRTDEAEYQELWKAFFDTIAIKERTNPTCQRNHLPLRFRPYMTEFQR